MDGKPDVSIVVTLLNEQPTVEKLYERTIAAVNGRSFELVFVDCGDAGVLQLAQGARNFQWAGFGEDAVEQFAEVHGVLDLAAKTEMRRPRGGVAEV